MPHTALPPLLQCIMHLLHALPKPHLAMTITMATSGDVTMPSVRTQCKHGTVVFAGNHLVPPNHSMKRRRSVRRRSDLSLAVIDKEMTASVQERTGRGIVVTSNEPTHIQTIFTTYIQTDVHVRCRRDYSPPLNNI